MGNPPEDPVCRFFCPAATRKQGTSLGTGTRTSAMDRPGLLGPMACPGRAVGSWSPIPNGLPEAGTDGPQNGVLDCGQGQ